MDALDGDLLVGLLIEGREHVAIGSTTNALLNGVPLVNSQNSVLTLKLCHALDLGLDGPDEILIAAHPHVLLLLFILLGLLLHPLLLCFLSGVSLSLGFVANQACLAWVSLLGSIMVVHLVEHLLALPHLVVNGLLLLEELLLLGHLLLAVIHWLLTHHGCHVMLRHSHKSAVHATHCLELLVVVSHHLLLLLDRHVLSGGRKRDGLSCSHHVAVRASSQWVLPGEGWILRRLRADFVV